MDKIKTEILKANHEDKATVTTKLWEDHYKEVQLFLYNPKNYPEYDKEWINFVQKRTDIILSFGGDTFAYDFKSEFQDYWLRRLDEIMREKWKRKLRFIEKLWKKKKPTLDDIVSKVSEKSTKCSSDLSRSSSPDRTSTSFSSSSEGRRKGKPYGVSRSTPEARVGGAGSPSASATKAESSGKERHSHKEASSAMTLGYSKSRRLSPRSSSRSTSPRKRNLERRRSEVSPESGRKGGRKASKGTRRRSESRRSSSSDSVSRSSRRRPRSNSRGRSRSRSSRRSRRFRRRSRTRSSSRKRRRSKRCGRSRSSRRSRSRRRSSSSSRRRKRSASRCETRSEASRKLHEAKLSNLILEEASKATSLTLAKAPEVRLKEVATALEEEAVASFLEEKAQRSRASLDLSPAEPRKGDDGAFGGDGLGVCEPNAQLDPKTLSHCAESEMGSGSPLPGEVLPEEPAGEEVCREEGEAVGVSGGARAVDLSGEKLSKMLIDIFLHLNPLKKKLGLLARGVDSLLDTMKKNVLEGRDALSFLARDCRLTLQLVQEKLRLIYCSGRSDDAPRQIADEIQDLLDYASAAPHRMNFSKRLYGLDLAQLAAATQDLSPLEVERFIGVALMYEGVVHESLATRVQKEVFQVLSKFRNALNT